MKPFARRIKINSSRVYLEEFLSQAASRLAAGQRVLDAGAGDCLYQPLFAHADYESADFCQVEGKTYGPITHVCDLTHIPVEDGRFDMVVCTQVLEHVPDPGAVLRELNRVLKTGGTLWLSAPLFFKEHEIPFDFYRYTRYGLTHLVEGAGFQVERLNWLEGYYGTLSYQLETAGIDLPVRPASFGGGATGWLAAAAAAVLKPAFLALSVVFARLDLRSRFTGAGLPKNHALVALKPPASSGDASRTPLPNRPL